MIHVTTISRSASAKRAILLASVQINFDVARQLQGNWCWAAVSSSVSFFFLSLSRWTQCEVAKAETGGRCCTQPDDGQATCNQTWELDKALTRTGNLKRFSAGPSTVATVKQELQAGSPLCLRIEWSDGGGHFAGIKGHYQAPSGPDMLTVTDPIYGEGAYPYTDLVNGMYQDAHGRWTHSYTTKK